MRANDPPLLFQHGGLIAGVSHDDKGRPFISLLEVAGLRGRLDRAAVWMKASARNSLAPARPSKDVIEDLMALRSPSRCYVASPVRQFSPSMAPWC